MYVPSSALWIGLLCKQLLKLIQPLRLVCRGVCLIVLDNLNLVHWNHGVSRLHILADGSSVLGVVHEFLYILAGEPVHELLGI